MSRFLCLSPFAVCAFITLTIHHCSVASSDVQLINLNQEFQNIVAKKAHHIYNYINNPPKFICPTSIEDIEIRQTSIYSDYWDVELTWVQCEDLYTEVVYADILVKRPNVSPSVALIDLVEKGGVVDSSIVLSIVNQYICLDLLGEDIFDFVKTQEDFYLPDKKILCLDDSCLGITPTNPGEFGYVTNIPNFVELNPSSSSIGYNVFCVHKDEEGVPYYTGFGIFFNQLRTENQIIDKLYEETVNCEHGCCFKKQLYIENRLLWDQDRNEQQKKYQVYKFSYEEVEETKRMWFQR
jgi:hypothetical protein